MLRLVVGLGNPGDRYRATRHNAGFMLVDALAVRWGLAWAPLAKDLGVLARGSNGLILLKPATFMNDSGRSVRSVAQYYKVDPADMLIVYDEVALPLGRLRLRASGSDGGHNGLRSIIANFDTIEIPRLRLGVGGANAGERRHREQELSDYVLSPFDESENPVLTTMIERAADCVETVLRSGVDAAMNSANRDDNP
jgi:PTH1 family peptidyl-tRNA hydrolase